MRAYDHKRLSAICPSTVATPLSNMLIAKYGILNALDIARCALEQVQASINQQKRLHPEEWRESETAQPAQPDPGPAKKPPAMPRITG